MNTQISNLLSKLSGTSKAGPRAAILQDLRIEIAAHSQEAGQQGQEAKRREIGQYAADVVEISAAHQANQARQAEITRQLYDLDKQKKALSLERAALENKTRQLNHRRAVIDEFCRREAVDLSDPETWRQAIKRAGEVATQRAAAFGTEI